MAKVKDEPKILYSDAHLLAVHKPAGYVIYKSRQDESLEKSLVDYLTHRFSSGDKKPLPVHRLDKLTCGIVLFAKSPMVASKLQMQFQSRKIFKTYLAVVLGKVPKSTTWVTKVADAKGTRMQTAKSNVKVVMSDLYRTDDDIEQAISVIRVDPETGRFHQIRQQCAQASHPILGDPLYGNVLSKKISPQLALVSERVEFMHPIHRKVMKFQTTPDSKLKKWLEHQFPTLRL